MLLRARHMVSAHPSRHTAEVLVDTGPREQRLPTRPVTGPGVFPSCGRGEQSFGDVMDTHLATSQWNV